MIKKLFGDGNGGLCVRRICGAIGFISCVICLFLPRRSIADCREILYVSAAFMGLTSVDKFTGLFSRSENAIDTKDDTQ